MREVFSARSSIRPRRQKCQASLWAMVASVIPVNRWLASLTSEKNLLAESSQLAPSTADLTCRKERLIWSHISEEMISRTVRAFSRALRKQERIELGFVASNVKN